MQWSERPPAARSRFAWLARVRSGPPALPVAVAHFILVRCMRATLRGILTCCLLSTAFVGCSTLGPDPSIHINGDSSLTWSDVREMERVLASLGIRYAITEITMGDHDRAEVYCETRHAVFNPPSRDGGDGIEVTLVRRGGHWVAVGPPRKSGRVILCA